ncbi:MAG: hypothetical protein RLZZ214_3371 [Verrucomicrobiota bacterium]|jgi:TPR repeat protein
MKKVGMMVGLLLTSGVVAAAPDQGASGIPEIVWWQTGGDLSFTALEKKAAKGNARAKAQLGFRMMMTRERPYDAAKVFKLLSQAARDGDALGHAGLSWCYMEGRGCPVDGKLQLKHATAAAATGFHHGIYQLALCHHFGYGVPYNKKQADALFLKAIDAGSPWAKRLKALTDRQREDGRKPADAELEELAARDFPPAVYDVGRFAINGRDPDACLEAVGRSARMGFVYGMGYYGNQLLRRGNCVEGIDWLLESEERGDPTGQGDLGKLIYEGDDEPKVSGSYAASFHFLSEAHLRGADDPDLPTKLAFQYCHGQGTAVNHAKAIEMIKVAWRIFDQRGFRNLTLITVSSAQIYSRVKPPFQDLPKAIAYAQLSPLAYGDSVGYVAWLNSLAGENQPNNPVRGWAAVLTGRRLGLESNTLNQAAKNLEGKLTPEQTTAAKVLSDDGFPNDLKFRQEAAAFLSRPLPTK